MRVVSRSYSTEYAAAYKRTAIPVRVSVAIFYENSIVYKPCHFIQ
jgi:hypothetical protein